MARPVAACAGRRARCRMSTARRYRVGVDIAQQFTDIVLLWRRRHDPHQEDLLERRQLRPRHRRGLERTVRGDRPCRRRHRGDPPRHDGGVNAILERKGARVGLITTEGFRDVLEIRTLRMPRALRSGMGEASPRWSSVTSVRSLDERVSMPAAGSSAPSTPGTSSAPSTRSLPRRSRRLPCAFSLRSPTRGTS